MAVPAICLHVHTRTQAQAPKHVRALSAGPSRVLQAVMENQQTKPGYTLIKQHIAEGRGAPPAAYGARFGVRGFTTHKQI